MIEIEAFNYTYPGSAQPALRDLSLRVSPGEFVLLAGPSGSGKSTLLRCLNGLVPHFSGGSISGRIRVAGLDPIALGPGHLSRVVGFLSQSPEAAAVLDRVEPEIAFGLENAAVPPDEMYRRVSEALSLLELAPLRQRSLASLSNGERQRVAIAAALVLRPPILAFDEPTSQLDPLAAEDLLRALIRLNQELGLTIVLAEHRLARVAQYANRLLYLEGGQLKDDAPLTSDGHLLAHKADIIPRASSSGALETTPLLSVRNVQYSYQGDAIPSVAGRFGKSAPVTSGSARRSTALQSIDLDIHTGEVIALMGRNGSGKTTLLKCMVGLLRPQQGQIELHGRSIAPLAVAEICRHVAYLPQNPDDLLFAETVADELATTLHNHGLPIVSANIERLLAQLGLDGLADAYPRDLSVGQRQRVALAAVAVTEPALYLLDEPTRGLDWRAKGELAGICHGWRAAGRAVLMATHDVELASAIADRIIVMERGQIIDSERPLGIIKGSNPCHV